MHQILNFMIFPSNVKEPFAQVLGIRSEETSDSLTYINEICPLLVYSGAVFSARSNFVNWCILRHDNRDWNAKLLSVV